MILGAHWGQVLFSSREHSPENSIIIGIDNSEAMLKKCRANVKKIRTNKKIEIRLEDIEKSSLENSSVVLMNWTLQFVSPSEREELIAKVCASLNDGGVLVLSEKIAISDQEQEITFLNLHEKFKQENGYSLLEIDQKRKAIEQVLKTETEHKHLQRLKREALELFTSFFRILTSQAF